MIATVVTMMISGTTRVDAAACNWSTDLGALRVSNRPVSISGGDGYPLKNSRKIPNFYRSFDQANPGTLTHQLIVTDQGGLVTNSQAWKGMPFVFKIEYIDGTPSSYITQERMGSGTCDLLMPGLTPSAIKSVTAYLAAQ